MYLKKFLFPLCAVAIFFSIALSVSAANPNTLEVSYTPLAPLPIGEGGSSPDTWTISSYLSGMLKLLIALGAAFAVLRGIIGGVQYIASGITPDAKNRAKSDINNAIIGLVIVLTSYLILNTINPKLIKFEWSLPPIEGTHAKVTTVATGYAPGYTTCQFNTDCASGYECTFLHSVDGTLGECTPESAPVWNDDSSVRNDLNNPPYNIAVNKPNCAKIGDSNCTSVYGLSSFVISSLKALKTACSDGGVYCPIKITGGTEYWLHGNGSTDMDANPTNHKPGKNVIDLQKGGVSLDNYIKSHTTTEQSGCANGTHYKIGAAVYVDETSSSMNSGPHWHVCYNY